MRTAPHEPSSFTATACGLAWHETSLFSDLPELGEHTSPAHVVAKVLRRSMKLLHATSAALFVRDDRAGGARLIAVASVDTLTHRRLTLLQRIPDDFAWPRAGTIVEHATDMLMLPADDVNHPLGSALAAQNASALYMALRYDDEVIGVMTAFRPGSAPFGEGDRSFARGLADQVTLALTAVHVV